MPNPIAAAVGLAALDTLIDEQLVEHAAAVGAHLLRRLASIDNPIIRAVCGGACPLASNCTGTWQMRVGWLDVCFKLAC